MSDRSRAVLLLGATFDTGNMGVGALTDGALTILASRYPLAEIRLLDYGREAKVFTSTINGRVVSVRLINLRFSWKVLLPNNVALLLALSMVLPLLGRRLRMAVIRRNRWLKAITEADIAVAVSGGDSFSDVYGIARFLYVSLPQLLVAFLGIRLVQLPQTIGPFKATFSRIVARFVLRRSLIVYSRDIVGTRYVRDLLGLSESDSRVRFCHDMGFVIEPRSPRSIDLGGLDCAGRGARPLIGVNVSGLLLTGGYGGSNAFRLGVDYRELIDRIIKLLIETRGATVLLVPHVFGSHGESDAVAAEHVAGRLAGAYPDRLYRVRGSYDQNEIKYIIGQCDFFVGSRMHACIAALSQGVPAVGVAYSGKFAGVFESVGVGQLVADARRLRIEEILKIVDDAFATRESVRTHLQGVMPEVKANAMAVLGEVE